MVEKRYSTTAGKRGRKVREDGISPGSNTLSLGEGAAGVSLDAVHMKAGVQARVQVG